MDHYWPSDRCQQYHDVPDSTTLSPGSCPAMLSIPDDHSEQGSDGRSSSIESTWGYMVVGIVAAVFFVGLVSFGGYKYYNDHYLTSRATSGSTLSGGVDKSRSTVEMSFNNVAYKHTTENDLQLSIADDIRVDDGDSVGVDLANMAGIYSSSTPSFPQGENDDLLNSRPSTPPPMSGTRLLMRRLSSSASCKSIHSSKRIPVAQKATDEDSLQLRVEEQIEYNI
jgi:hypothetical protein